MFLKTMKSLIAHQLFKSMGELGSVEVVRGLRPLGMVYTICHGGVVGGERHQRRSVGFDTPG